MPVVLCEVDLPGLPAIETARDPSRKSRATGDEKTKGITEIPCMMHPVTSNLVAIKRCVSGPSKAEGESSFS